MAALMSSRPGCRAGCWGDQGNWMLTVMCYNNHCIPVTVSTRHDLLSSNNNTELVADPFRLYHAILKLEKCGGQRYGFCSRLLSILYFSSNRRCEHQIIIISTCISPLFCGVSLRKIHFGFCVKNRYVFF